MASRSNRRYSRGPLAIQQGNAVCSAPSRRLQFPPGAGQHGSSQLSTSPPVLSTLCSLGAGPSAGRSQREVDQEPPCCVPLACLCARRRGAIGSGGRLKHVSSCRATVSGSRRGPSVALQLPRSLPAASELLHRPAWCRYGTIRQMKPFLRLPADPGCCCCCPRPLPLPLPLPHVPYPSHLRAGPFLQPSAACPPTRIRVSPIRRRSCSRCVGTECL